MSVLCCIFYRYRLLLQDLLKHTKETHPDYAKLKGMHIMYTVEPLYKGHFGTIILVLITEVSSIQRSFNTVQYYTGTQNGVLIIEVSTFQRFVIERSQCICTCVHIMYVGTYMHKYVPTYIHIFVHTYICIYNLGSIKASSLYDEHTFSGKYVHTYIHAHTFTHTVRMYLCLYCSYLSGCKLGP